MEKFIQITLILISLLSATQTYEFEQVTQNLGAFVVNIKDAYISHSRWRLYYYYDLTDFYDNVNIYRDSLIKLEEICSRFDERNGGSQCTALVRKHKSFLEDMNIDIEYLEIIQNKEKRKRLTNRKRREALLPSVGTYIFKPLFGIMDEEDAEDIASKINKLASNQQTHYNLIDQNLSLIGRVIVTANETMEDFKKGMEKMNIYLENAHEKLREMEEDINQHLNFGYISELATNIKIEYSKTIDIIKKVIQNKLVGEYTEIMTYRRLVRDLQEVELEFDDSRVRLLTDPLELQNAITISGAIVSNKLLIELEVPMVDRKVHTLQKIVRLPMRNINETYVFELPYLTYLVQNETRQYIPIHTDDLAYCQEISRRKLLCYPQRETHYADDTLCESNILFNFPQNLATSCSIVKANNMNWIIGLNENQYYMYPRTTISVTEKCMEQSPVKFLISSPGIIKLDVNCELYTDKIIIYPRNTRVRNGIADLPVTNRTQGIKIDDWVKIGGKLENQPPPVRTIYKNPTDSFENIMGGIETSRTQLKEKTEEVEKMETDYGHTIRDSIIGCTIIVVSLIIFCVIKKCLC